MNLEFRWYNNYGVFWLNWFAAFSNYSNNMIQTPVYEDERNISSQNILAAFQPNIPLWLLILSSPRFE